MPSYPSPRNKSTNMPDTKFAQPEIEGEQRSRGRLFSQENRSSQSWDSVYGDILVTEIELSYHKKETILLVYRCL